MYKQMLFATFVIIDIIWTYCNEVAHILHKMEVIHMADTLSFYCRLLLQGIMWIPTVHVLVGLYMTDEIITHY